ncbi:hypothetical protein MTO96_020129 [Rhipicephalus appendiculatus]
MQAFLAIILPWLSTSSADLAHLSAPPPTASLVSVADQHMPSIDALWVLFEDRPAPSTTTAIATDSFKEEHLDAAFSGHESSGLHTTLSHYFFHHAGFPCDYPAVAINFLSWLGASKCAATNSKPRQCSRSTHAQH